MTVANTNPPKDRLIANGVNTAFTYTFEISDQTEIDVYIGETLQTLTTDYVVSGVGNENGGTVTFVNPPAIGSIITLVRNIEFRRTADFQASGSYFHQDINNELDRLWFAIQQLNEAISRAISIGTFAFGSGENLTLALSAIERANKAITFDASGNISTREGILAVPESIVGQGTYIPRVNAGATGYELRSPGQTLVDIGAQPLDGTLSGLADLVIGANQMPYATATNVFAATGLSAFARTLLDDVDAATARATLGISETGGDPSYLASASNLNDVANKATARSNLGVVSLIGDTMSGDLTIAKAMPKLFLNASASNQAARVSALVGSSSRWEFGKTGDLESGSNTGSNFVIKRFNDAGAQIDDPLTINRATGQVNIAHTLDVGALTIAGVPLADFTGDSGSGGTHGFVPAPAAGDAAGGKYLKADGTWTAPPGSGGDVFLAGSNVFTNRNEFRGTFPNIVFNDTDSNTNAKKWRLYSDTDGFVLQGMNDAETVGNQAYIVRRNGATISRQEWYFGSTQAAAAIESTGAFHTYKGRYKSGFGLVSSDLTITADYELLIYIGTGGHTLTLPHPVTIGAGFHITIKALTNGCNIVTPANVIYVVSTGITTIRLNPGEVVRLISDGGNWVGV